MEAAIKKKRKKAAPPIAMPQSESATPQQQKKKKQGTPQNKTQQQEQLNATRPESKSGMASQQPKQPKKAQLQNTVELPVAAAHDDSKPGKKKKKKKPVVATAAVAVPQQAPPSINHEEKNEDDVEAFVDRMGEQQGKKKPKKSNREEEEDEEEEMGEDEFGDDTKQEEAEEEEEVVVPTFAVRSKKKRAVVVVEARPDAGASSLQSQIRKKFSKQPAPVERAMPPLKYTAAPMVGKSDLAFRMLCRRYGVQLAYTPMYEANLFATDPNYRSQFQTHANDRPLAVQFCGNDPDILLQAARSVEKQCDLVDINLGCPQRRAHAGHYGAFLLDDKDHDLVFAMVRKLAQNLAVPVSCKIRLLPTPEATLKFCLGLEKAGCAMIAVHARYRGSPTQPRSGPAHLDQIPALKRALSIPVVTNGNTKTFEDVTKNLASTECDGLMAGEGLLDNPALFAPSLNQTVPEGPELAVEYLALCRKYGSPSPEWVRGNVLRMCRKLLLRFQVQLELEKASTLEEIGNVVSTIKRYRDDPSAFKSDPNKHKEIQAVLSARKKDKKTTREEEFRRKKIERRAAERAAREAAQ